jgi:hypothetical protein
VLLAATPRPCPPLVLVRRLTCRLNAVEGRPGTPVFRNPSPQPSATGRRSNGEWSYR